MDKELVVAYWNENCVLAGDECRDQQLIEREMEASDCAKESK